MNLMLADKVEQYVGKQLTSKKVKLPETEEVFFEVNDLKKELGETFVRGMECDLVTFIPDLNFDEK